ncbi:MAG: hypothetical protein RI956_33, partial [Pseudomonadota bacterium]
LKKMVDAIRNNAINGTCKGCPPKPVKNNPFKRDDALTPEQFEELFGKNR